MISPLGPTTSYTIQLSTVENWEAEWQWQQQSGSVSSLSPFSEARSSQQLAWQRNDTESHSFSKKYSMAVSPSSSSSLSYRCHPWDITHMPLPAPPFRDCH